MKRLICALAVLAVWPASAQALELGVQDDGRSSVDVLADVDALHGGWTRTTAYVGEPGVAQRIRDAHRAGLKIILTVGGTGTRTRRPTAREALTYIRSLPRADVYGFDNEVDLDGVKPCVFYRRWMAVRRVLGSRLGLEFSPHSPLRYTAAMRRCGRLPKRIKLLIHAYQPNDPFAPSSLVAWAEGGMGNLGRVKRVMRAMGVQVEEWIDEFSYAVGGTHMSAETDELQAWLWPRAVARAKQLRAKVLIVYTAKGSTWNTRPGPLGWCALTSGRRCPTTEGSRKTEDPQDHREPIVSVDGGDGSTASTVAPDPNPPTTDLHSTDGEGTNLGEPVTTTAQTTNDGLQPGPQPEAPNDGSGDPGST